MFPVHGVKSPVFVGGASRGPVAAGAREAASHTDAGTPLAAAPPTGAPVVPVVVSLRELGADPVARVQELTSAHRDVALVVVADESLSGADWRALIGAGAEDVVRAEGPGWRLDAAIERARRSADVRSGADRQRLLQGYSVEAWTVLGSDAAVIDRGIGRSIGAGAWAPFSRVADGSAEEFAAAMGMASSSPGQAVWLDEASIVDAQGTSHDVEIVLSDLSGEPSVGGILVLYWDIERRVRAAAAAAFQATLLAAVDQAVVAVDPRGCLVYWNDAAARLYGWTAEEALGRHFIELFAGRKEVPAGPAATALAEARKWSGESWAWDRAGRHFPAAISVTPVTGADGEVEAVIAVCDDISERRETEEALRRLAAVVESSGDAIISFDLDGHVTTWNPAAEGLYRRSAGDVVGRCWPELTPAGAQAEVLALVEAAAEGRSAHAVRTRQLRKDGTAVPVAVTVAPLHGKGGCIVGLSAIVHDVTEEVLAAEHRAKAEARFQAAFEQSSHGMALADCEMRVTAVNPAVCSLLGRSEGELLSDGWARFLHPDDPPPGTRQWRASDERGAPHPPAVVAGDTAGGGAPAAGASIPAGEELPAQFHRERRFLRRDGTVVTTVVDASLVRDPDGAPAWYMIQLQDVTAHRQVQAELEHRALHDDLTGLPNRALIAGRLDAALAANDGRGVGVVFVDIDGFSHINDVLGHDTGDRVLVEIGSRLQRAVRSDDTVGRFGGDEFVLICEGMDVEELAALSERISDSVEAPITVKGHRMPVRVGLGITMSRPGSTSGSLLSEAGAAVSRAKELGRGQAAVFDESLRAKAVALLEGEQALRAALDRGEIVPHFQPVVDLASGKPRGFEALARWVRGNAAPVPAEHWITMAQKSGLIVEVSEVILARAVADAAEWNRRFPEQRCWVSVNVDASQLVETRLAEIVDHMLGVAGLDPHLLHLEITETVVMDDIDASVAVLQDLRNLGVHLCIDDFGTGYSSLSYLRHLPVDALKIDRSFVAELGTADGDPSIVRAVVGLTQVLGLACVAEGVETEAQRDVLRGVGCPLGQGYLWSRPLPAADAGAWLAAAGNPAGGRPDTTPAAFGARRKRRSGAGRRR